MHLCQSKSGLLALCRSDDAPGSDDCDCRVGTSDGVAIPLGPFNRWPHHSAASRSAVGKSTFRAHIHKSSRFRECFAESAKSPQKPTLSPVIQILNDFPGVPLMSPEHQCVPSRLPLGKRCWARFAIRSSKTSLIRFTSLISGSIRVDASAPRDATRKTDPLRGKCLQGMRARDILESHLVYARFAPQRRALFFPAALSLPTSHCCFSLAFFDKGEN